MGICECLLLVSVLVGLALLPAEAAPGHHRPDLARDDWQGLDGTWQFAFDPDGVGEKEGWQGPAAPAYPLRLRVPFPWESPASGVARPDYRGVAWYRRELRLPRAWQGRRVWLCFGAVDWQAAVWVNGVPAGSHEGGYSEFRLDISSLVRYDGPNLLVVRAEDHTDPETPIGKQVPRWYTSSSGIWQSVWVEATGPACLQGLRITPLADDRHAPTGQVCLDLRVDRGGVAGPLTLQVRSPQRRFAAARAVLLAGQEQATITLGVPRPRCWTPETPVLYPLTITLAGREGTLDRVHSYFGLRTVAWGRYGGSDHSYVLLNGQPVYLRGALDQSFNPEGLYTAPSDDFLRRDIELAKAAGFNMVRIHIKADEPRRLYWADRLGMLIQADIPCHYQVSARARANFEQTLRDQVARDYNHPAIYCWTVFNEEWGIGSLDRVPPEHRVDWVERMWQLTRELDPTRLVQDNTGWSHLTSDLNSFHWYGREVDDFRRQYRELDAHHIRPGDPWNYIAGRTQRGEPFVNNEYGYVSAGAGDGDWSWGTLYLTNALRACPRLVGYTYTELTDIEWEHNGCYHYDRSPKEFGFDFWAPGMRPADLFSPDFLVLDAPAIKHARPGERVSVPALFSHYSGRYPQGVTLHWQVRWLDNLGAWHREAPQSRPCPPTPPYRLTGLGEIVCDLPHRPGLVTLAAWLQAGRRRLHTNYTQWLVGEGPSPRAELASAHRLLLRFRPEDWATSRFATQEPPVPGKHYARGAGTVEYRLRLPAGLPLEALASVSFLCEASAKAGREKVAWPQRVNPEDYPQTDATKFPTTVRVLCNGAEMATWQLPDDPADARGVLSHWQGVHRGSYGCRMQAALARGTPEGDRALSALAGGRLVLRLQVPAGRRAGGLALYGETTGCYPLDPTVIITFSRPVGLPAGWRSAEPVAVDVAAR